MNNMFFLDSFLTKEVVVTRLFLLPVAFMLGVWIVLNLLQNGDALGE
jgi:hypothetical protein